MVHNMKEYAFSEYHMGTEVTVSLIIADKIQAKIIADTVFKEISVFEKIFSRFLPDSELSQLNKTGKEIVSESFLTVLNKSLELVRKTNGAFNPLVQVASLGYNKNFSDLAPEISITKNPYNTDIERIKINQNTHEVILASHQQLDFGGVLKGYLADKLTQQIKKDYKACAGCIINIGGDIATFGYDEFHEPFIFFIYNPITHEEIPVTLTDACLATSGTYKRLWQTNIGQKHHLVNTLTQESSDSSFVSVSIIHNDGAVAEAYTKLFINRNQEEAISISKPDNIGFILINNTGEVISNVL